MLKSKNRTQRSKKKFREIISIKIPYVIADMENGESHRTNQCYSLSVPQSSCVGKQPQCNSDERCETGGDSD